jgi:uncharacterized membrane protein
MLFTTILVIHVISGFVGLLLGSIVLIRKKGDILHKKIGAIFAYSMVCTALCAFILSYLHSNFFLFIVGIFTLYLSISGYRMIGLKKVHEEQKPKMFDAFITASMLIASLTFIYNGILLLIKEEIFGITYILFGFISIRLCYSDLKAYREKVTDNLYWLKNHIGRMTGAYIAAFTAFLVVNNTILPPILAWALPGIIGGIFILRAQRKLNS